MSYRKVRFEYYQVVYRKASDKKEQRDRLFDLLLWMDAASKKSLEGRTYDYYSEQARLESAYWDTELGFSFLHFLRLRETNLPSKAKKDSEVEPFELDDDEYLGEDVSALYDETNHVLMLQRNKYSLGPEGIEEYLNLLWNEKEEQIYLRPISPPNAFDVARRGSEYRKINLRFADINTSISEGFKDKFKSPLKKVIKSFGDYEGINAQITITMGKKKNDSLNEETISDTLDDIEENPEYFSKAEIAKKDNEDSRVELIDLFAHKAHDFGNFKMEKRSTLSHQAIAKEMWMLYSPNTDCLNRQQKINQYLKT
ncbi:hypothetical protein GLW00_12790 [Halobacillus litoralis]|uniref:Uncharacterized protein n=1 Tax=Halobacillus litoralis TaxID=45668 RepID=A0A845FDL9_9BACI|nr:DUF6731 family protein [Halobacillus litoralis]MYL71736.1 hypothetical protein [Halobacillus litoralis]